MKTRSPSVNLLSGSKKSSFDKFIDWALTFGRLLVILTEAIALGAFLYRFFLDRELVDLHDKINQKQAIVNLSKANEEKFRNFQERLKTASQLEDDGGKTTKIFQDIYSLAPADFSINSLALSKERMTIDANVQSITSLARFVKSLSAYPVVSSISIDKIENKTSNATIAIGITATMK